MARRIKTKPDKNSGPIEISGWIGDKDTKSYLWFGLGGKCIGTLSDQKLYRLAKAIVRQFEQED